MAADADVNRGAAGHVLPNKVKRTRPATASEADRPFSRDYGGGSSSASTSTVVRLSCKPAMNPADIFSPNKAGRLDAFLTAAAAVAVGGAEVARRQTAGDNSATRLASRLSPQTGSVRSCSTQSAILDNTHPSPQSATDDQSSPYSSAFPHSSSDGSQSHHSQSLHSQSHQSQSHLVQARLPRSQTHADEKVPSLGQGLFPHSQSVSCAGPQRPHISTSPSELRYIQGAIQCQSPSSSKRTAKTSRSSKSSRSSNSNSSSSNTEGGPIKPCRSRTDGDCKRAPNRRSESESQLSVLPQPRSAPDLLDLDRPESPLDAATSQQASQAEEERHLAARPVQETDVTASRLSDADGDESGGCWSDCNEMVAERGGSRRHSARPKTAPAPEERQGAQGRLPRPSSCEDISGHVADSDWLAEGNAGSEKMTLFKQRLKELKVRRHSDEGVLETRCPCSDSG
ncbi:hypothetical protein CLOM_g21159 [Closterium sp. NIES-68]|nr:hypothetical protein CLOM_g21159 [Closterium sp. NIES-68]